jgi:hypothetical protein
MIIFLTPLGLYQPHLIHTLSIEVSIKVSSISQNQTRAFTRPNPNMPSGTEDLHPSPYLDYAMNLNLESPANHPALLLRAMVGVEHVASSAFSCRSQ